MKKTRVIGLGVVAVAVAAVLAAPALAIPTSCGQEPQITFRLQPNTCLEKNITDKIKKHNEILVKLLDALRLHIHFNGPFNEAEQIKLMEDTYLKDPKLPEYYDCKGWNKVLVQMKTLIGPETRFTVQNVQVSLEYLPFGKEKFNEKNRTVTENDKQIDIIVYVKTVLAYDAVGTADPTVTIEGELEHRRICDPI